MPAPSLEVEGTWPRWAFCGLARSCFYGPGTLADSSRLITVMQWCLDGGVTVVAGGRGQGRLPCNGFWVGEKMGEVGLKGEKEVAGTRKAMFLLQPRFGTSGGRDLRSVTSFPEPRRVTTMV